MALANHLALMDLRQIANAPATRWLIVAGFALALAEPRAPHRQPAQLVTADASCSLPHISSRQELYDQCHPRPPADPPCEASTDACPGSGADHDACRITVLARQVACVRQRERTHPLVVDDWGECEDVRGKVEAVAWTMALTACVAP